MVAGLVVEFQPIMPQNHKFRQNQEKSDKIMNSVSISVVDEFLSEQETIF